jgi:CRISPR/Cas system-associated endoribonuclease Cas2
MPRSFYLVGYDIKLAKSRRIALRRLRAQSLSYQDSVFELELSDAMRGSLLDELSSLLAPGKDKLFCGRLSRVCHCWQLGHGAITPTGSLLVIN